jgi:hypothetical protein
MAQPFDFFMVYLKLKFQSKQKVTIFVTKEYELIDSHLQSYSQRRIGYGSPVKSFGGKKNSDLVG